VTISALVERIDYAQVKLIFHIEVLKNVIEFAQGIEWGGHDKINCLSYMLMPRSWKKTKIKIRNKKLLPTDRAVMQRFLDSL
jgi:hypothetical protein